MRSGRLLGAESFEPARAGIDSSIGEYRLAQFAEMFGRSASSIIPSTGWVIYVVGPELKIKHFLAGSTKRDEQQDYERHFARLDPLAPEHCIADERFVACLHEELSPRSEDHLAYRSNFMRRHHIVDALEIFLKSEAGIILGCSLLRHDDSIEFLPHEIRQADGLRAIGDFTLSQLLPKRRASIEVIAARFPVLTAREATLMQLVAVGLSNKQLCQELDISLPTVKSHLLNIFRKVNVRSRTELVAKVLF